MKNTDEVKKLLQEAMNLIYKVKCLEEDGASKAQTLGLQGEKRRLRYESSCNHNLLNYLRCDFYDSYGEIIKHEYSTPALPNIVSIADFFANYLELMEEEYDKLHTIANNLVQANSRHYAGLLYKKCDSLMDNIKYYRRIIAEGKMTNWNPVFIMMRQTTRQNVHDEYEDLESKINYPM